MRTLRLLSLSLLTSACAHVYGPRPIESNPGALAQEMKARAHIEKRARHDFAGAFADFSEGMKVAVPLDTLTKNWTGMEERWGPFVGIEGVRAQTFGKGWAAIVVCRFESDVHVYSIFFDSAGEISGSWGNSIAAAEMFIDALGHHRADWADALTDGQMHDVAPPEKLEKIWAELESRFGKYERVAEAKSFGLYSRIIATFGQTNATFNVALDPRGKVTGFHIVDVGEQPGPRSKPPPRQEPQLEFERQSG